MTETRTTTVAETRFVLREQGAGPGTPVVLLHGVPETSAMWRHLLPRLARDRRVVAPDLPGLGGSAYTGPYDVASLVEQLVALLDAELPGQRVDLVGHDWGGALALGLAGTHPDRVRRLVVANTAYRSVPVHRTLYMGFLALPLLPEVAFRVAGRRLVEGAFAALWKAPTPLEPEVMAEYVAAYGDAERARPMVEYYRAAVRPRVTGALPGRRAPRAPRVEVERALVVWGVRDSVLPVHVGEGIVRDLGATASMVTIPGAGHFVVEEAPEAFAEAVEEFLLEEPAPPRKAPARRRTSSSG